MPTLTRRVALLPAAALVASCALFDVTPPAPVASGVAAWEAGPLAPASLTEVAATTHDGRIWTAGGYLADGRATDRVLVLDPVSGSWTDGPALPAAVHHSSLVSDGSTLYLLGGYVGDGPTDVAWMLRRPEDTEWLELGRLPEPRAAGAAGWDGDRIVYAGGVGPAGVSGAVFALEGDGWRSIGALSEPREHLAATSDGNGSVFFLGGRRGGLGGNLGTVDLVAGGTVSRIGELPTPRGGVAAFWWPALGACLVGGESPGGTNAQVECIGREGTLLALPELARPRHGLGAVVLDGRAYALLGGERPGLFVSDAVEVLDLP